MQFILGQYKGSAGNKILNLNIVLIVGLGPGCYGDVSMFFNDNYTGPGGINPLTLKLIYAFFTGKRPGDYRFLNPRTNISTSISLKFILL